MPKPVILLSIPALREKDVAAMPKLRSLMAGGEIAELTPGFPCVTCPVQAAMTTGRRPAEHGIVANGHLLAGKTAGGDVDRPERLRRAAADLGSALASRAGAHLGRLVPAAQQGLRGGLRLHARPDSQSRRLGVALVLHAAGGTLRRIARRPGALSADELLGPDGGHPVERVDRRLGGDRRAAVAARLLLYLSAAARLRRPAGRARQRGRRRQRRQTGRSDRPARRGDAAKPTATICSGSPPASTPLRRSITSAIRTASCARPGLLAVRETDDGEHARFGAKPGVRDGRSPVFARLRGRRRRSGSPGGWPTCSAGKQGIAEVLVGTQRGRYQLEHPAAAR